MMLANFLVYIQGSVELPILAPTQTRLFFPKNKIKITD